MKVATFKRGIHPYEGKELSKNSPTQVVLPKGDLVYPMSQHIGAPAKPLVVPGDQVMVGQKIGQAVGAISANVFSSVSGTVKAIEPRLTASGTSILSIVVENDNASTTVEGFGKIREDSQLSKEEIREYIKEAGIVGMGGAGFPTYVKLTPKSDSAIEYVIVNGAECEPYLTSDYRMMLEETERLVKGLKIVLKLFEHAKGIIAIEDNKPDCIAKLQELVKSEERMEVKVLITKYPQGAERQLIYATTGRKLNSSLLPYDLGCVVLNIDTVISICSAVRESTPLIRRIITVSGDAVNKPGNFNVKTGMNYRELIELVEGFRQAPEKIISGGPMMGTAIYSLDIPVTKASSALLCFTKDEVAEYEPTACIRCGKCLEVCPCGLIPQKLVEYSDQSDEEGFQNVYGMECYECGSCTYICPAKRRLTQSFKQTRRSILDKRKK